MLYQVATFYKFAPIPDLERWRTDLRRLCHERSLKGTILLAAEGLNATISGARADIEQVLIYLANNEQFLDVDVKWSESERRPFQRMKVRIKREIVTIGDASVDPTTSVGNYVPPASWNELLDDPAVTVVDTRNDFEVAIGSFDNAINPRTKSFRDFTSFVEAELSPQQNPKVALFCTGGIRCEKATSFMLNQGFEDVYHLDGGILNYLTHVDEQDSRWHGECFVFDERITVTHDVEPGNFESCQKCGEIMAKDEARARSFQSGICCERCRSEAGDN